MDKGPHNQDTRSNHDVGAKLRSSSADEAIGFTELWCPENDDQPKGPVAILLETGKITTDDFKAALEHQKNNRRLGILDALIETKVVDEVTVQEAVAAYFNIPFQPIKPEDVDPDIFKLLDSEFIKKRRVIPIKRDGNKIVVGISDPADIFLIDEVKRRIGKPIQLVVTPANDIIAAADELAESPLGSVDDIIEGIGEDDVEVVETKTDEVADLEKIAGESPVIRYVNFLITKAVESEASDIHIEPCERTLRIRYRIDGVLFEQPAPPLQMHPAIVSRLKIMANLDIAEHRLPQDGRIRAMVHGRHIDLRISTLPTTHGEKCVIRILDNRSILRGLENLGMWDDTLEAFRQQITQPHGIILVTGPTGSGKTTTLYSALQVMDGERLNISTVEDPVEYQLDFANQVNVRENIGLTFAVALRSLLRQDPDVIMIGEIRDEETARIAVQASLTGHLVLSTLHTNDAPSSVMRLMDIGIEPYLISASLNAVLAQRLVRRICENCKTRKTKITPAEASYLEKHQANISQMFHGTGCEKCRHTGYSGRLGIYEMLVIDDEIRELIRPDVSLADFRRMCIERGMRTLVWDGLQKVQAGLTTVEEIARVTET